MSITQADLDAAAADIHQKVTDRFTALEKLLVPDPPPPPPPSTPAIRFADHRYYGAGPIPTGISYWDLQHGTWETKPVFPGEKYRYATTTRCKQDSAGTRQYLTPASVPDSWCVHSTTSAVVSRPQNGGEQLLDISDGGLVNAIVANMPNLLAGYDGLYLDEIDETWSFGYPGYTSVQEFSTSGWRTATTSFVTKISQAVHALGKKTWANVGGSTQPWRDQTSLPLDAVNIEFLTSYPSDSLTVLSTQERRGKAVHAHVMSESQPTVDFGFALWLLGTEFHGSFSASSDYAGRNALPSSDLLVKARALGSPLGSYLDQSGSVYIRQFEHGKVSSTGGTWSVVLS